MQQPERESRAETPSADRVNPLDIFSDPAKLALPLTFSLPIEQVLLRVKVRKPHKQTFFRVCPDESFHPRMLLLEYGESRDMYLVLPGLHREVSNVAAPYVLYYYLTRDGTLGLWPVRLPGPDGRSNAWWDTAHAAAEYATENWLRLEADGAAGCYRLYRPREGVLPDPEWPSHTLADLLRLGFQDHVIDSADHIILQKLRGEA